MKILVVDDEAVSLQKLALLLRNKGECDTASSGEQALGMFVKARMEEAPYDLVTLDVRMSGMSGPDVAQKIRKYEEDMGCTSRQEAVKILMVTGMADGKTVMASFKHGCDGYLKKPFNKDEIMKALTDFEL